MCVCCCSVGGFACACAIRVVSLWYAIGDVTVVKWIFGADDGFEEAGDVYRRGCGCSLKPARFRMNFKSFSPTVIPVYCNPGCR